jgi:hypothetical protein
MSDEMRAYKALPRFVAVNIKTGKFVRWFTRPKDNKLKPVWTDSLHEAMAWIEGPPEDEETLAALRGKVLYVPKEKALDTAKRYRKAK